MIRDWLERWILGEARSIAAAGGEGVRQRVAALEARLDRAEGLIQLIRSEMAGGPQGIDRRVLPPKQE